MKKLLGSAIVVGLLLMVPVAVQGAKKDAPATLTGEWLWNNGPSGDLEAVFTPTGDKTWDVAFHFEFRGKPRTYEGTATGDLKQGELKGTVKNENKKRTFIFAGTFEGDSFSGTHAETTSGEKRPTGTLSLSR